MEINGEEPVSPENTETAPSPEPLPAPSSTTAANPTRWIWQGKLAPAFWMVACIISLTVNLILIAVLLILAKQVFGLKGLVEEQLIGGSGWHLYRIPGSKHSSAIDGVLKFAPGYLQANNPNFA
jgi:hypothetical protein